MKIMIAAISAAALLGGCATQKNWTATGGSRADATVRLSFEYGPFEIPQTNEAEAINLASARCAAWGYNGAEAFGGSTTQCTMGDGMGGCNTYLVSREFQCTGNGDETRHPRGR